MNKADECVYPSNHDDNFAPECGLRKREHFAAMAMQGLISSDDYLEISSAEELAAMAVSHADALLKELEK